MGHTSWLGDHVIGLSLDLVPDVVWVTHHELGDHVISLSLDLVVPDVVWDTHHELVDQVVGLGVLTWYLM